MNTITVTNARTNLFQLLKKTLKSHLPARISSREGNVILIPEEDYENLIETAELLSIPGLKESIEKSDREILAGEISSFNEVFKEED